MPKPSEKKNLYDELDTLRNQRDKLAEFTRYILNECWTIDGESIRDKAETLELVVETSDEDDEEDFLGKKIAPWLKDIESWTGID